MGRVGAGLSHLKAYLDMHASGRVIAEIVRASQFHDLVLAQLSDYAIVGISTGSHSYNVARELAGMIKKSEPSVVVVVGGPHVTCLPGGIGPEFDYGVIGEGEETLLELVLAVLGRRSDADILAIPGVTGRRNGRPVHGARRRLIANLDTLPLMHLDAFRNAGAVPPLVLSRGCPFDCRFCVSPVLWTRAVRRPSAERLVAGLVHVKSELPALPVFVFKDDVGFVQKSYLSDVLSCLASTAPSVTRVPKVAYMRAELLDLEFARLLKDFGVYKLFFGFESGSDAVLRTLKGRSASVEANQRAIDICCEVGLKVRGHFILGVPEEREDDLVETFKFIVRNARAGKLGGPTTTLLTPYPGSRYWTDFTAAGEAQDLLTFDWERLDDRGFSSYYVARRGRASVADWWRWRTDTRKICMTRMPMERFLGVLETYLPEVAGFHARFVADDMPKGPIARGRDQDGITQRAVCHGYRLQRKR